MNRRSEEWLQKRYFLKKTNSHLREEEEKIQTIVSSPLDEEVKQLRALQQSPHMEVTSPTVFNTNETLNSSDKRYRHQTLKEELEIENAKRIS